MSIRMRFALVWLVCLALLGANVGIGLYLKLGPYGVPPVLAIATAQAFLVAWFFLHLRHATGLVRVAAFGALFWLAILFGLGLSDYLSRGPS